ncbi:phosphoribosylaminoimidazolesuccinocarboxamide synthase [Georgenia halophila]|uniref:Phosphoribosylaminoimidazole-succinocarboxamide synthase n=2 Tax=Georgenia halophila TaxID=620889 RepID=A0ABP8KYC5_9MICO
MSPTDETAETAAAPSSLPGWTHTYSGKVRDLYVPESPSDGEDDVVLVVASDRISAYDHVLPTPIPDKGRILAAMSLWWFDRLADLVGNHVVSTDVPDAVAGRAMVCRRLEMYPVECVARGYLTGSVLAEYRATGSVAGHELPEGLRDGDRLPEPIFTPATKAEIGEHDENIDLGRVAAMVGPDVAEELRTTTLAVYTRAAALAAEAGILLADTKLEFGAVPDVGGRPGAAVVLGDEVLTPDSSRFWAAATWEPGRPQPSYDKQYVRDFLTSADSGWDRASDAPPPPLPDHIVDRTRARYLEAYEHLTGRRLAARKAPARHP